MQLKTINNMNRILLFLIIMAINGLVKAQISSGFNYQALVRDANGEIISNSIIGLQISIINGSENGTVSFSEIQFVQTNYFGKISLIIGSGTNQYGLLDTISWGDTPYYLKLELDVDGGANYMLISNEQLLSVPYAFYGRDEDVDTLNEIQTLQLLNDTLYLSDNGGSIPYKISNNLGEVIMVAIYEAGSALLNEYKSNGWALCDGTTTVSQGFTNPIIQNTPDLRNSFIRMSNNNNSGTTGGSETHNHGGLTGFTQQNYPTRNTYSSSTVKGHDHAIFDDNNLPPFGEVIFLIKVK